MLSISVLITSLLLQLLAVYFALRLIKVTGRKPTWIFIAAALALMALHHGVSLMSLFGTGPVTPPDILVELIALAISVLLVVGIIAALRADSERQQEQSDQPFRRLADSMPDNIIRYDRDGRATYLNPALAQQLGINARDRIGKRIREFHTDGSYEAYAQAIDTVLATGEDLEFEFIPPLKLDSPRTHALRIVAERDEHGTVIGVLAISRDVTERKQMEDALRSSEQRFHAIFNQSVELIGLLSADGTLLEANPAALKMAGVDAAAVLGKPFWETPWWSHSAELQQRVREAIHEAAAGHIVNFEAAHPDSDGDIRYVDFSLKPVTDADGRVIQLIPEGHDVTERKRAATALAASERQFRSLSENSPDNIVRYDRQCRTIYYNPRVTQTLAIDHARTLGRTPTELGYGGSEVSAEYEAHIRRVLESGNADDMELTVPHPDGTMRNHLVRFSAEYDDQGEIVGVLAIGRDITELKQAERDRQRHARFLADMDRINRAIQGTGDLDTMMANVLDEVLDIFDCDRAFLLYPCDPDSPVWRVPMEQTRPEYPGALAMETEIPMTPGMALKLRQLLNASGVAVNFGAEMDHAVPAELTERFNVKSMMAMAITPIVDKPWEFGIQQCSDERHWTADEAHLLEEIGRRLTDGLTSLLIMRDLRDSESRYRRIVDTAREGVLVVNEHGRVSFANSHLAEMLGYAPEQLQDRLVTDFMFEEDLNDHQLKLANREQNRAETYERRLRKHDQALMWALVSATPIFEEGHYRGALAMVTDITALKEAELQLRLREKYSQSLLRLSRRLEQAQSPGDAIVAAQEEVETMLGYQFLVVYLLSEDRSCFKVLVKEGSLNDLIDKFSATLPIPGDPMLEEIAAAQDIVVVEDARTDPRTNKARAIVEQMKLLTIINVPVFLSGRHLGTIATGTSGDQGVRNPTPVEREYLTAIASHMAVTLDRMVLLAERTRAEEALRNHKEHLEEEVTQRTEELRLARDAAETANKAKSVFLANMSHELRTPLNAILGFSQMLHHEPGLTASQRDNLEIINHSGEHLLKLINDVLEIAKIEAGKLQLETSTFDLHGLVRDVTDMMLPRAKQKGLRLLVDQSSEFPRYIKGDEARLRQILINLVGNAVKFTDEGGVTIRLGVRQNTRQHLLIEVEDTGPGISAADQKHLFKPFVQLTEGMTHGGTGLGLSIVRQYVQLMGGNVTVDSTPGKGSLFLIDLPLEVGLEADIKRLHDEVRSNVVALAPGQPAYRILIAEDQRDNQLLLARLMSGLGLETRIANNGLECVSQFEAWQPDLIWMDRRMPLMDGLEATRRIRELPGGDKVKIVAVTASVFKEQEPELRAAGIDEYVRKPYRFHEIYDSLGRQLGLKFAYQEDTTEPAEQQPARVLSAEELSRLAPALREDLRGAVESLDRARIDAAISRIRDIDAELADILWHLVDEFNYPHILDVIQTAAGTSRPADAP
ncbi:MAG: PAS domain S-box protein [Pseudomonadota bacterium]